MNVQLKKRGRPAINQSAFDFINNMRSKEIFMSKNYWKLSEAPGQYLLRKKLGKEYRVQTLADDSGWLITRL